MRGPATALLAAAACIAGAAPTGLNVIPTTDLTPLNNVLFGFANANTSFTGTPFYRQPLFTAQSEYGLNSNVELGLDYGPTPDLSFFTPVFNAKALLLTEDDNVPNVAVGVMNVALLQAPTYYVTVSKTLNYEEQQAARFRAHHRSNRKLLGRRAHLGMMLDGHGLLQPFAGTDLQISDSLVFQADYVHGSGNNATAGLAYVLPDNKTTFTAAILFSNDTSRFSGISISLVRQFGS